MCRSHEISFPIQQNQSLDFQLALFRPEEGFITGLIFNFSVSANLHICLLMNLLKIFQYLKLIKEKSNSISFYGQP